LEGIKSRLALFAQPSGNDRYLRIPAGRGVKGHRWDAADSTTAELPFTMRPTQTGQVKLVDRVAEAADDRLKDRNHRP
jgi:hypothetical protein